MLLRAINRQKLLQRKPFWFENYLQHYNIYLERHSDTNIVCHQPVCPLCGSTARWNQNNGT